MPVEMNAAPMARTPVATAGRPRVLARTADAFMRANRLDTFSNPPFRNVNAKPAANVATRSATSALEPITTALVTVGYSRASSATLPITGPTVARTPLNAGSSTVPIVTPRLDTRLLKILSCADVLAVAASYSACIEPAYLVLSLTISRFFWYVSSCVSIGAIAPIDSLPNSCESVAACMCFGSLLILDRMTRIVSSAFSCIDFATCLDVKPSCLNASRCDFVADAPAVRDSSRFLIPVAAISFCTPIPRSVAPIAAIEPEAAPATLPSGPMRCVISRMSLADAAVLLPR